MQRLLRLCAASFCLLAPIFATAAARAGDDSTTLPKIDPAAIKSDIAELASDAMNGRSFRSDDGKRAAQWVADRLARAGAKPLDGRDSMLVPLAKVPAASPNVVAWLPPKGAKPSGEFVLVTAHYDHLPPARTGDDRIYNGADDNASGVCGMLAVANALRDDALDVGVVFVGFTGEEAGLLGSTAFVEQEILPAARIRGVFNMDMISRQPDGAIRLDGGPKSKVLVDLLVRLAPKVPIEMKVDTHPDWLDRSDQGPFLRAGIPAVLFSCEDHEDYHQVSDHADKVDANLAARTATLVALATRTYAKEMAPRFDLSPVLGTDGKPVRTIRVGRTMPNAPYWKPATRRDPDRGIDAAVLEALAKETGWKFEEKQVSAGEQCAALASGEVDLVLNGATAALAQTAGLSKPIAAVEPAYLGASGTALLIAKDSPIGAQTDLAPRKIAVRAGTSAAAFLAANRSAAKPIAVTDADGAIADKIKKGELDAFAGDALTLEARAKRDASFRAVRLGNEPSFILCRADDEAFRRALGGSLASLARSGELGAIHAKYGVVRHAVMGQDKGRVVRLSPSGAVEWEFPCGHNSHDLQVLANGNYLLHPAPDRIVEVTADKKTVWEWQSKPAAPNTQRVEIHGFQRLSDGNTMVAETSNLRIIEVNPKGEIVKSVPITVERPDPHRDTRRVRKTDAGTYLACHEGLGLVREYDATGKIVWEYALDLNNQPATGGHDGHGTCVFNAVRLKNGNTLIGGGNNNRVFEVTPDKKVVWSIERDELKRPDGRPIHLCWVTSLQVLPNGNVIFGNTHAGEENPQMVEVTRDKKVVWTLDDWSAFGNDLCTGWCIDLPEGTIR